MFESKRTHLPRAVHAVATLTAMARDRRTTRLNRVLAVCALVAVAASIARIGVSIHSAKDLKQNALALPIGIVIVAVLIIGICWPIVAFQRWRGRRLTERFPGVAVWTVTTGMSTRYLVLTEATIALVAGDGAGRTWPLDQVRGASVQQMPVGVGLLRRSGMRLALGNHTHHETVDLLFPKWLGLTASIQETNSAVAAVQQALRRPAQTHDL